MLKTNQEISAAFKKFPRPSKTEIINKISNVTGLARGVVNLRFKNSSFTIDERKKVDPILDEFFAIMPQVLESQ